MTELEELQAELTSVQTTLHKLRDDFNEGRWAAASSEYKRTVLDQEHNMSEYVRTLNQRIFLLTSYTTAN